MKAFLFSDLHASTSILNKIDSLICGKLGEEIKMLVFAGDLVNMGEPVEYASRFIELVQKWQLPLLWVPGNNDFGPSYELLINQYPSLEGKVMSGGGRKFSGLGGSPASWSGETYQGGLPIGQKEIDGSIFVSHYPPAGIHNYIKTENKLFPTPINLVHSPLVHICGHWHTQEGLAYLGQTKIVKLGAVVLGHYAIIDLQNLKVFFHKL